MIAPIEPVPPREAPSAKLCTPGTSPSLPSVAAPPPLLVEVASSRNRTDRNLDGEFEAAKPRLALLTVFLPKLFQASSRQLLRRHHEVELHARIECQENRFCYGGSPGWVGDIDNKYRTTFSAPLRKVNRLRLDVP